MSVRGRVFISFEFIFVSICLREGGWVKESKCLCQQEFVCLRFERERERKREKRERG